MTDTLRDYISETILANEGKLIDSFMFKFYCKDNINKERFVEIIEEHLPETVEKLNKGKEISYIHIGAEADDQRTALIIMAIGGDLEVWKFLTPNTVMPSLPDDLKRQMAGSGMISITGKLE